MDIKTFCAFNPAAVLCAITLCTENCLESRSQPNLCTAGTLEALAQSCGLHLRFLHQFSSKVFVVCVENLHPEALTPIPEGQTLRAELLSHTRTAARYDLHSDEYLGTFVMGYQRVSPPGAAEDLFKRRFLCLRNTPS